MFWAGSIFLIAALASFSWLYRRSVDIRNLPRMDDVQRQMEQAAKTHLPKQQLAKRGKKLEYAGQSSAQASKLFFREMVSAGTAGLISIFLVLLGLPSVLIPCMVIIGLLWPSMRLNRVIRARRSEITMNLPFYLDLLTLSMEAGLDLIASLDEIIESDHDNPLKEEVSLTLKSIQMGKGRSEAFQRMADRTGVVPLNQLASVITQSEELGSSLGNLLRTQSDALRRQIFREAEEKAQKAPLRMLMPLVLFIFPVAFILLFVPLIMNVIQVIH